MEIEESGRVFQPISAITCTHSQLQGEKMGKGGIDTIPSDERTAPAPPPHLANIQDNPESLLRESPQDDIEDIENVLTAPTKLLPRETGEDIGMGSPVPLSSEAVGVITRLRNMKVSSICSNRKWHSYK